MILETEEEPCSSFEPVFESLNREETFYALDTSSKFQVQFSLNDLKKELPCKIESQFQVWDSQDETWVDVTDLDTSLISDVTNFSAVIDLTLADLEKLSWFDPDSGTTKWRLVIFDPEYTNYAPSLEMKSALLPGENRIAIQELDLKITDGTFIKTDVSCPKCRRDPLHPELLLLYD